MASPSPHLLEQLATSRFLTRAEASVGLGERRSALLGSGLEFAAHRSHREGDDTRHVDARLLARLGDYYIRQFAVERQLPITILVDASASMQHGAPDKFATAITLAQLLAFVCLTGGDRVELAIFVDGKLEWSPKLSGGGRVEWAFDWLAGHRAKGSVPFGQALREINARLPRKSQLILISDWWDEDALAAIGGMGADGHEMLALHLQSPDEIDPLPAGRGSLLLRDVESRDDIEIAVDAGTIDAYRAMLSEWRESLRRAFLRLQGRYIYVSSATSPEYFLLRELRSAGVIS